MCNLLISEYINERVSDSAIEAQLYFSGALSGAFEVRHSLLPLFNWNVSAMLIRIQLLFVNTCDLRFIFLEVQFISARFHGICIHAFPLNFDIYFIVYIS